MPKVKKETIIQLLKQVMPDIHKALANMDKSNGWIKLPENFIDILIQWKFNWWQYYENEQLLKAIGSTIFLDTDGARELFENTSMDEIYHEYGDFLESVDEIPIPTKAEQKVLLEEFELATKDEQDELLKPFCKIILGFLSVSFNYLALMVHGRSMCQLVTDAKNGDDNAYRCAVQIDRSVLRLEYFQDRLMRAKEFGIEDVGHIRKRLKDYRRIQRNSKYF